MTMVPAMFIFGDSLIDNGNNNGLPSFARANYYPYGIDFKDGPSGRFSNGYTMVDEIAELLGLPLIPSFPDASDKNVLHGVNYALAAAGILDITGGNFIGRIPFHQQRKNFESSLDSMAKQLGGEDQAYTTRGQSIFFVGMDSNDYLNNYKNTKGSLQVCTISEAGNSYWPVCGCWVAPLTFLAQSINGSCLVDVNKLVIPFNNNVRAMVDDLNANLPGSKFIFLDIYKMFDHLLSQPQSYGFSVVDRGCCGNGRKAGQMTCLPFQTPCVNRDSYIFWDAFHPTERVNIILGCKAFTGPPSIVYPMNIKQLASSK